MFSKKNIIRKLLWDGRTGHSTYLMFFLTFANFILIVYNYLFQGESVFGEHSSLWLFGVIFAVSYFPISVLIGRWHTKTQISTDNTLRLMEDPIRAKMIRVLLDVQTGKATKAEIEEFRKLMLEIEKRDIKEY